MANKKDTTAAAEDIGAPTVAPDPTAIYEVICREIEIDSLICYRTHRLSLTKARAEGINNLQPDSLQFVGV